MFDKTIVGQRLNHKPTYLKCKGYTSGRQQLPETASSHQQPLAAASSFIGCKYVAHFCHAGSESIVFIIHNLFSLPGASAKCNRGLWPGHHGLLQAEVATWAVLLENTHKNTSLISYNHTHEEGFWERAFPREQLELTPNTQYTVSWSIKVPC